MPWTKKIRKRRSSRPHYCNKPRLNPFWFVKQPGSEWGCPICRSVWIVERIDDNIYGKPRFYVWRKTDKLLSIGM